MTHPRYQSPLEIKLLNTHGLSSYSRRMNWYTIGALILSLAVMTRSHEGKRQPRLGQGSPSRPKRGKRSTFWTKVPVSLPASETGREREDSILRSKIFSSRVDCAHTMPPVCTTYGACVVWAKEKHASAETPLTTVPT